MDANSRAKKQARKQTKPRNEMAVVLFLFCLWLSCYYSQPASQPTISTFLTSTCSIFNTLPVGLTCLLSTRSVCFVVFNSCYVMSVWLLVCYRFVSLTTVNVDIGYDGTNTSNDDSLFIVGSVSHGTEMIAALGLAYNRKHTQF